jgi:hypothetical protein
MVKISFHNSTSKKTHTSFPTFLNLKTARLIEDIELSGLTPSTPRPYKPKEPTTSDNQPTTPAVKKKKKLLEYHLDRTGHAALKKSFKSVFATVTLTLDRSREP